MKTVFVLLYPGCIFFEVALATELIAKNHKIVFATPEGEDHIDSNGATLKAHIAYKNVDLANAAGVIVPGGTFNSVKDNQDSDRILQEASKIDLWIGAICGGAFLLGKSGILNGRKISHGFNSDQLTFLAPYFKGVEFSNEKFTADKKVLTAKPEAHIEFAVELAARLLAVNPTKVTQIKEYYRGGVSKIRPIALGLFKNSKNQYLYHQGFDNVKKEYFYRPLGGGIDFGEAGNETLFREIQEELGLELKVGRFVECYENIFTFEGRKGHELVMLYDGEFLDKSVYDKSELDIYESGHVIAKAVWRSSVEIKNEGAKIYPLGLEELIKNI